MGGLRRGTRQFVYRETSAAAGRSSGIGVSIGTKFY